ncbi:MAG: hypothetical protein ACO1O1_06160 [Adhaeribacter sp.]
MNRFLSLDTARQLLDTICRGPRPWTYDQEKHRLVLPGEAGEEIYFRLPIPLAPPGKGPGTQRYVLLLIQAGNCAMGYFEDGRNLDHKVFRAYMVRKKQGVSQVKYLKTKGKSRAGSRVRLGETEEFFENINQRLQQYFTGQPIDRIALSCSKTLLPFLYSARVATPFDKRDPRLFKIPRHVHTPIYEVLLDTHKYLMKGELTYGEASQPLVSTWLQQAAPGQED